jgi:sulfide:quinone oxidoreductase
MTETWASKRSFTPEICIVTAEHSPLAAFGPEASEAVAGLLAQRGIRVHADTYAASVTGNQLWIPIEGAIPVDLAVALPFLVGPLVEGLPGDELGFVPVDAFCRVEGLADVYAIGDMTRQPLKQGGLAAQMADVAAACIAADAGAAVAPEPFTPVLRALLFTGGRPLYLRNPPESEASTPAGADDLVAPWWPAHKIVSGHLGPFLATHADLLVPVSA